jgi:hypothetical protein
MEKLHPFQDGVMKTVNDAHTPFYLTGGTALSRYYFGHRYSDDLDYFVNAEPAFHDFFQELYRLFEQRENKGDWIIDKRRLRKEKDFAQIFLIHPAIDGLILKLDFVNDLVKRFGSMTETDFGKIDSWENILSNKLAALYRFEPKDVADIWIISKNRSFAWNDFLSKAREREGSVDPIEASRILWTFPPNLINVIKWAIPLESSQFLTDLQVIGRDILNGCENSLFPGRD